MKTATILGLHQHDRYLVVVLLPGSSGDGLMPLHTCNNKLLHLTENYRSFRSAPTQYIPCSHTPPWFIGRWPDVFAHVLQQQMTTLNQENSYNFRSAPTQYIPCCRIPLWLVGQWPRSQPVSVGGRPAADLSPAAAFPAVSTNTKDAQ